MDNWSTFRTVLQADKEAFDGIVAMMQQQHKASNIIADRQQLEIAMIPFASLSEAVAHYLEVMDQIENGTYVDPDEVGPHDGGKPN